MLPRPGKRACTVAEKELPAARAVEKHALDAWIGGEEGGEAVGLWPADGAVQGAAAFAGVQDIPQGKVVLQEQRLLFPYRLRDGGFKDVRQYAPEGVAGVGVIVGRAQGRRARRSAEDKHLAACIHHGGKACNPFHANIIAEIRQKAKFGFSKPVLSCIIGVCMRAKSVPSKEWGICRSFCRKRHLSAIWMA